MVLRAKDRWPYLFTAGLILIIILIPFHWFLGVKISLFTLVGISTMITLGLCLLMGYTGQVSLGQAAFYGIGAYVSAILSATYDVNPWLAMAIAATITGAFAYFIGYPIFRLRGNYLAMATLGLGIIIWILFKELDQYTGGPDGIGGIPNLSIGGFSFDTSMKRYYLVWFFCLAILLASQNIVGSRVGRALRAIHGGEAAAQATGINTAQFKVKIFVLSAVYASLAGSLYAHVVRQVSPGSFDFLESVVIVTMAVIGGLASIWGAIFGASTILILKNELLVGLGEIETILYGLILVLVMIFMPKGLFVSLKELYEAWRLRYARRGDKP